MDFDHPPAQPIYDSTIPFYLSIMFFNRAVFIAVFDQFDMLDKDGADRAACARCARVCRSWSEPALKALWKTLSSTLLPLYSILLPPSESVKMDCKGIRGREANYSMSYLAYLTDVRPSRS